MSDLFLPPRQRNIGVSIGLVDDQPCPDEAYMVYGTHNAYYQQKPDAAELARLSAQWARPAPVNEGYRYEIPIDFRLMGCRFRCKGCGHYYAKYDAHVKPTDDELLHFREYLQVRCWCEATFLPENQIRVLYSLALVDQDALCRYLREWLYPEGKR